MGNSTYHDPTLFISQKDIQKWSKVEDKGAYELWMNKNSKAMIQAYPIPQSYARDNQQLKKYSFRKTNSTSIVAIQGIYIPSDTYLCSEPRSAYILVQNIIYRLTDLKQKLSFQQALYVLLSASNGYNTLNSFFGPLEPHQDMICLNEKGQIKVWLNQNLSKNEASRFANNTQLSKDPFIAQSKSRQSVGNLFKLIQQSSIKKYPDDFKQDIAKVSTFFQVYNFVEFYRQRNNIEKIQCLNINNQKKVGRPAIQKIQQSSHIINNDKKFVRLDSSRVENIFVRSSNNILINSNNIQSRNLLITNSVIHRNSNQRSPQNPSKSVPKINFIIQSKPAYQQNKYVSYTPQIIRPPQPQVTHQQYFNTNIPNNVVYKPNIVFTQNIYSIPPSPQSLTKIETLQRSNHQAQTVQQNIRIQSPPIQQRQNIKNFTFKIENEVHDQLKSNDNDSHIQCKEQEKQLQIKKDVSVQNRNQNIQQQQIYVELNNKNVQSQIQTYYQIPISQTKVEQRQVKYQDNTQEIQQNYQGQIYIPSDYARYQNNYNNQQQDYIQQAYIQASQTQTYVPPNNLKQQHSPIIQQQQSQFSSAQKDNNQIQQWQAKLNKFTQSKQNSRIQSERKQQSLSPPRQKINEQKSKTLRQRLQAKVIQTKNYIDYDKMSQSDLQRYIRQKYKVQTQDTSSIDLKRQNTIINKVEQLKLNNLQYRQSYQYKYQLRSNQLKQQEIQFKPKQKKALKREQSNDSKDSVESKKKKKLTFNLLDQSNSNKQQQPKVESKSKSKSSKLYEQKSRKQVKQKKQQQNKYYKNQSNEFKQQSNNKLSFYLNKYNNGSQYNNYQNTQYTSQKQQVRNKVKKQSRIDQRYNKYVLNAGKNKKEFKNASTKIQQSYFGQQSKIYALQPRNILQESNHQTYSRHSKYQTKQYKDIQPFKYENNRSQKVTYQKLRNFIWEE